KDNYIAAVWLPKMVREPVHKYMIAAAAVSPGLEHLSLKTDAEDLFRQGRLLAICKWDGRRKRRWSVRWRWRRIDPEQGRLHGAGGNFERLDENRAHGHCHDRCDEEHFNILADSRHGIVWQRTIKDVLKIIRQFFERLGLAGLDGAFQTVDGGCDALD